MTGMSDTRIGVLFHGVGTPQRALEPGEADYWIGVSRFEAILDRVVADPNRDRIHLSFDDGNLSDHDTALPRLISRGLRADFFVLSDRLSNPGSLDPDRIRAMVAAGMGVGSHGAAHRDWRSLDDAALAAELGGSRTALEAILGAPVETAGIPFGRYDRRVLRALRKAGYRAAYSSDRGRMDAAAFLRPRTSIRADTTDADVDRILNGTMSLRQSLRRAAGMALRRFV